MRRVADATSGAVLAEYAYDANGNATRSDTAASEFSAAHRLTLTYDAGTRMTTRIDDAEGGQTLAFQYGGAEQRVLKEVRRGDQLLSRKLYVHGTSSFPLYEATDDGSGGVSEVLYVFGPAGLLALRRGGRVLAVMKDHLGSTRRLVTSSGEVVASYDYLSFGTPSRRSELEAGLLSYLYTGHEYDSEVGLYNFRARFYSGDLGRFLAVDPEQQFFSPYLYAANNPVLYIDPSGTFSLGSLFSAIGGALIGAVEILIGVAVDVVAAVLGVVTGGLSTPPSIALASLAGVFYGAGVSAITYSVFNVNDFSWKDYGIQMGIGAAVGAISFGFGSLGGATAEFATGVQAAARAGQQVSTAARAGNYLIRGAFDAAGWVAADTASATFNDLANGVTPGADVGWSAVWSAAFRIPTNFIPLPAYKAGWGNLGKRFIAAFARVEVVGLTVNVTRNVVEDQPWDKGLLQSAVRYGLWTVRGTLQPQAATTQALQGIAQAAMAV